MNNDTDLVTCETCDGHGRIVLGREGTAPVDCPECDGTGDIESGGKAMKGLFWTAVVVFLLYCFASNLDVGRAKYEKRLDEAEDSCMVDLAKGDISLTYATDGCVTDRE